MLSSRSSINDITGDFIGQQEDDDEYDEPVEYFIGRPKAVNFSLREVAN